MRRRPPGRQERLRTSWTSQIGGNPTSTTTACTDSASRLTSTTGPAPIPAGQAVYDGHGNATQLGTQAFRYDGADRVTGTTATTIPGTQTLAYTRDSTDRVVARTAATTLTSGGETGTTRYAFTDGTDAPDFQLTPATALGERYLSLPGGVLYTKNYGGTGTDTWALPNLHGDITATCTNTGLATLKGVIYDPYGQPINANNGATDAAATPGTRTGTGTTDAWHGNAQRGYEHTGGLNSILMGARSYLPALGTFTATDPIPGGNTTTYAYPQDPINTSDLDGRRICFCGGGSGGGSIAFPGGGGARMPIGVPMFGSGRAWSFPMMAGSAIAVGVTLARTIPEAGIWKGNGGNQRYTVYEVLYRPKKSMQLQTWKYGITGMPGPGRLKTSENACRNQTGDMSCRAVARYEVWGYTTARVLESNLILSYAIRHKGFCPPGQLYSCK